MFDPKWNSFVLDNGKRLRSWSKVIKLFSHQVDTMEIAIPYAAKHNRTVESVIAEWEAKGATSREWGTFVHQVFDDFISGGQAPDTCVGAVNFINDFFVSGRLIPVESELVVYNEEASVATLVDCVCRDKAGRKYIIDWKTDGVMKDNAYGRRLKMPFNILPDHPLMHHKLQVNLQKSLYPEQVYGMYIGHILKDSYKLIPVEDMALNPLTLCTPKNPDK